MTDETTKEITKSQRSAGKGMAPKKGYNQSLFYKNYDLIDWKKDSKSSKFTSKNDENTTKKI